MNKLLLMMLLVLSACSKDSTTINTCECLQVLTIVNPDIPLTTSIEFPVDCDEVRKRKNKETIAEKYDLVSYNLYDINCKEQIVL